MDAKPYLAITRTTVKFSSAATRRAMEVTNVYWFAMFAASALGTNVGDLWAGILSQAA
ncbi:MAG: hypothetical protein JO227_18860 [Acetobacteraceae bacterium]|nr:hypothetical protein [Acetobacteraceae bacterium]